MVDESDEPGDALNVTNEAVLASIEYFLIKKQRSNLVMFETKTWEEVNNYESYRTEPTEVMNDNIEQTIDNFNYKSNLMDTVSHKLRKHRYKVYSKARAGKIVTTEICKYQPEVQHFIGRFKDYLSPRDIIIWNEKHKTTTEEVMNLMEANEVLEGPQVFSQLEPEVSIDKTDQEIMIMSLPSVPNDLDIETEERFQKQEMRMTSPNEIFFF